MSKVLSVEQKIRTYAESLIPNGFYTVKILSVYDGDTSWAEFNINGEMVKNKLRFRNIDTPELRSKDPKIKAKAIKAKGIVTNIIRGETVLIYVTGMDHFFRSLAFVFPSYETWTKLIPEEEYKKKLNVIGGYEDRLELNEYLLHTEHATKSKYEKFNLI